MRHDMPYVRWVFTKWISRRLPTLFTLEMSFAWIFGWHANRIKVERVRIAFREPEQSFISTGKTLGRMKTMLKMPDDTVA